MKARSLAVDFHKTRRGVRTSSSEQVRQPIFRDRLDRWRTYGPWMAVRKPPRGAGAKVRDDRHKSPSI
jgi:hypothetical protein